MLYLVVKTLHQFDQRKDEVKITLQNVMKAKTGVEIYIYIYIYCFFNLGARWGGWFIPWPRDPVPIVQEVG